MTAVDVSIRGKSLRPVSRTLTSVGRDGTNHKVWVWVWVLACLVWVWVAAQCQESQLTPHMQAGALR